jgi:hypothetical protein
MWFDFQQKHRHAFMFTICLFSYFYNSAFVFADNKAYYGEKYKWTVELYLKNYKVYSGNRLSIAKELTENGFSCLEIRDFAFKPREEHRGYAYRCGLFVCERSVRFPYFRTLVELKVNMNDPFVSEWEVVDFPNAPLDRVHRMEQLHGCINDPVKLKKFQRTWAIFNGKEGELPIGVFEVQP